MEVGISVAGSVAVGGGLAVGVSVGVAVSTVSNVPGGALARNEKNTMDAATMITTARIPTAAGKLKVIAGMRLACTDLSTFFAAFGSGRALNSVPHTRQRVAFSLKRVPQVGQTFVLLEVGFGAHMKKNYTLIFTRLYRWISTFPRRLPYYVRAY